MAYTKTTWVNNDAPYLNADNLNNMETGIFNNDALVATKLPTANPGFTGTLSGPLASITQMNTSNLNVIDYTWSMVSDQLVLTYNDVSPVHVIEVGSRTLRQTPDNLEYANKNVLLEGDVTETVWGSITGTLSEQIDLQDALNLKGDKTYVDSQDALKLNKADPSYTGTMTAGGSLDFTDTNSAISFTEGLGSWYIDPDINYFNIYGDETGSQVTPNLRVGSSTHGLLVHGKKAVVEDAYATDLVGGTIKIKVIGTDAYITTDGSTPGA